MFNDLQVQFVKRNFRLGTAMVATCFKLTTMGITFRLAKMAISPQVNGDGCYVFQINDDGYNV